jgi:hypothetical protein
MDAWLHTLMLSLNGREGLATRPDHCDLGQRAGRSQWAGS